MTPLAPPLKCQGIKTKLVPAIQSLRRNEDGGLWIEPFCGSCVVPLNVCPAKALLCDSNEHVIRFYSDLQSKKLTAAAVREYLTDRGARLERHGEAVYYEIREEFNQKPDSLAFLFLNRACFNGVMRFNRKGKYNVPFCRKPKRFAPAYITKITNQVDFFARILQSVDWTFRVADFRDTLKLASEQDFVYADPPYQGRHVDYYNSWSDDDECELIATLKRLPCPFVLSTWYQNKYRKNPRVETDWSAEAFTVNTIEHFYHVGPTESLRNSMTVVPSSFELV